MKRIEIVRLLALATALVCPLTLASPQASGPIVVASVDPPVPPAAGSPCVTWLFRDQPLLSDYYGEGQLKFTYAPPPNCPGPWAKVVLKMDLMGDQHFDATAATLLLAGRSLLEGGTPDLVPGRRGMPNAT